MLHIHYAIFTDNIYIYTHIYIYIYRIRCGFPKTARRKRTPRGSREISPPATDIFELICYTFTDNVIYYAWPP